MTKPRVCILVTDGINCDGETLDAFCLVGGQCQIVHMNQLIANPRLLMEFQVLVIPGGFSYGDDIASGKILALLLIKFLGEQLQEFVDSGRVIIGICNGFQALVRMGLLPFLTLGKMHSTLTTNVRGSFICRWANVMVEPNLFTAGLEALNYETLY